MNKVITSQPISRVIKRKNECVPFQDISAAALISQQRRGWEVGYLISDTLPCLPSNLRLTATAWKSKLGAPEMQPKLQVSLHAYKHLSCHPI